MQIVEAIYWSSLGLIAYTYAIYPVMIHILSLFRRIKPNAGDELPPVTIVLAVRNEKSTVGPKLRNLLTLDYPSDKLSVVVVSDGSTDGTADIVKDFGDERIRLVQLESGAGKSSALNCGVSLASSEIIVFCDVRQRIEPGALRALVAHFPDPSTGAVSGELHVGADRGPGVYWKYEKFIRVAESRFASAVGATGHLYAIRRSLFKPLPPNLLLDDLYTPMQIVLQGYRVLFEPDAKVFDQEASIKTEYWRKARTLAGNYQLIHLLPDVLNPFRNRIFVQYVSHKIFRLFCPYAFLMLLISNIWLLVTQSTYWTFYAFSLAIQMLIYALALIGALGNDSGSRLVRICHTFVVFNAAAVEGLRRYLIGDFRWH
ncbi:glycosyltransferase family 2 protein [Pseudomonadota bacterium]